MRSIHPQNFITIACIVLEICTGKNLSTRKTKGNTQKLSKQELRVICTVPPLHKIYPPTKFHNHSKYSFGNMHRTKLKYESKQRAITKKKQTKVTVHVHCTPLEEIYPPTKFHNHS